MNTPPPAGVGSWRSLEMRLPVLVALLLITVVAALSLIAQRALEDALLQSARAHTERVAGQLSGVLAQSSQAMTRQVAAIADSARRISIADDDSRQALARLAARHGQVLGVGVHSADAEWQLWADGPAADSVANPPRHPPGDTSPLGGPGPIRAAGGSLYYDATAQLPSAADDGEPTSRLIVRWRIAERHAGRIFSDMVGEQGVFLVGSQAQDAVWSDLAKPIPGPTPRGADAYTWDDASYRGSLRDVAGTPWQVWVALPEQVILAPADALAKRMAVTGLFILLLGTGAALLLGRHVSIPIVRLTRAVELMSSGRYHDRVPETERRRDEIGRLAASFNVMADRVEEATENLESQVAERTRALESALAELRGTQEQLVRREKLAILGHLASGVGHELRNPLAVMTNAVYFLEMVLPDATPQVKEYLGILRAQLGLSEKIVADLLDFARTQPPQRDVVPLEQLVEEQLARLGRLNGVTVERDYDPAHPAALVDGVQVGQIVFNLLLNAVQAMSAGGGAMVLRTRQAPVDKVTISISDSGPGIPPEDFERIFEPLYTTKARGIGLGLAVSRNLADANDGELRVESRPGAGATFTVTLPAA